MRVFITGPARGIGAELARRLHGKGAKVALAGLEADRLEALSKELGDAPWFECDVRSWDDLDQAVQGTVDRLGGIDVVVANAGINSVGTIETIDRDAFERVLDVNLLGVWRTVRAALPHLIASRGYALCIASIYAAAHGAGAAAYTASKAGVEAFADALRVEMKPRGVDVGVAYYSFLDTDLVREAMEHPAVVMMRENARWPLNATSPVGPAVEATVRAIENRSRTVVYPRWVRVLLAARGLIQPLAEPRMARDAEEPVRMLNETQARRPPR